MKTKTEVFSWKGSVSSPRVCPFKLLSGAFYFRHNGKYGYSYLQATNFARGSWGEPAMPMGGTAPIPHELELTWLSWIEAKVYTGIFSLPTDTITQLFRDGFMDFRNRHAEYECLIAGLLPGGGVVLWVWGNMNCVEVARFQAVEKEGVTLKQISPYAIMNNLKEYCDTLVSSEPDIVEYVAKHGVTSQLWDTYRERFQMRPVVEYLGKKNQLVPDHINIRFLNGEYQCLNYEYLHDNPFLDRARPKYMEIYYSFNRDILSIEIRFDEEEILDAYSKIYGDNPDNKAELVLTFCGDNYIQKLALRGMVDGDTVEIKLDKADIKKYRENERIRHNYRIFNPNNED